MGNTFCTGRNDVNYKKKNSSSYGSSPVADDSLKTNGKSYMPNDHRDENEENPIDSEGNSPHVNVMTVRSVDDPGQVESPQVSVASNTGGPRASSAAFGSLRSASLHSMKPGQKLSLQSNHASNKEISELYDLFDPDDFVSIHDLYNMLNDGAMRPYIHDPYNLLVIDARPAEKFSEDRVITARLHSEILENADFSTSLSNFGMIVLYNGRLNNNSESKRVVGIQKTVKEYVVCDVLVLKDGYDLFKSTYPFLCTELDISSPWDRHLLTTYPSIILDSCLYQGRGDQATNKAIIDALQITHIVNISLEHKNAFPSKVKYYTLHLEDATVTNLLKYFTEVTDFIGKAIKKGGKVLVHCNMGVSRSSTCTLAYLMKSRSWSLEHAFAVLKARRSSANPNIGFLRQLSEWEETVLGEKVTNIDKL